MPNKHEPDIPLGLESFIGRMGELQAIFGPAAAPTLAAVKDGILHAMAARDRGDMPAAVEQLGAAMDELATFAEQLGPAEAAAMRAVAQMFRGALSRGDESEAKRVAAVMFEKSGARERKPQ